MSSPQSLVASNINPKTCTPMELRRVGVIFSRREQKLKCVRCEAVWRLTEWIHKRPRNYWVCPNGCNTPSNP
jgi:hypothetical protein